MKPFSKRPAVAGLLLLLALVLGATQANAWWDAKWQLRKKVTFDTTPTGGDVKDALPEVPVLVRLHSGNFEFKSAKPDGSDIRFVSVDDKTALKFHIEKYDPNQGIALIWVRVAQVAGASNQNAVYLYYGNGSASAAQDAGGTYDTAEVAVFHFGEKDGSPKDATGYANHAADFKGKTGVPAIIGNGAAFNGAGDRMTVKAAPSLAFAKGFSFSAWVKIDQPQKDAWLFSREDGKQSIVVGIDKSCPYARLSFGKKTVATKEAGEIALKGWHHLAVSADPSKRMVVYIDGREAAAAKDLPSALPEPAGDLSIGASLKGDHAFAGVLDEVRIASVARPAVWFAAEVAGEGEGGKLTSLQAEESGKSGGGESLTLHLLTVVARTITLDGWVIIGLLASLSAFSWYVFIEKARFLRMTAQENEAFSGAMKGLANPLDLECESDEFDDSSLYRVYMAGCEEVGLWLRRRGGDATAVVLPAKVVNALRAVLEKAAMKESKRMGSGLLVLTLCVSGGPFLGLLGTVWGVMNTFASMAEAGEANLAAIAPGVASALACTLAGLVVAIPALFAYSYLTSNIKDLTAETNLFIDEFVLKMTGEEGDAG